MIVLRALAARIAAEPVVHLVGTVGSILTWLATYALQGWHPAERDQLIAGAATVLAYGLSMIARQYVTPTCATQTPPPRAEQPPPTA